MKYAFLPLLIGLAGCCSHGAAPRAESPKAVAVAPVTTKSVAAAPAPKPAAKAQPVAYARRETVSFEANDAELRDVIDEIARKVGVNIVVEPQIHEKVTLTLRDIPWMEAVQLLAERTRCEINLLRDGVYYVIEPPRVTLHSE